MVQNLEILPQNVPDVSIYPYYLEYPKELRELHNDYPLASDKIDIKREMLSEYQLKIADLYNISIAYDKT